MSKWGQVVTLTPKYFATSNIVFIVPCYQDSIDVRRSTSKVQAVAGCL